MGGWNSGRRFTLIDAANSKSLQESVSTKTTHFEVERNGGVTLLRLISDDGTNRLTREFVPALTEIIHDLAQAPRPLVISGNERFFSAGADLNEIATLYRSRFIRILEDGPGADERC